MIVKVIQVDGKPIKFGASASIPRAYRMKFQSDIMLDMNQLANDMKELGDNGDGTGSQIPPRSITIFENIAYMMAKHVDNSVPENIDDWLNQFDTFSIYEVLPELLELWQQNNKTMSVPKKK